MTTAKGPFNNPTTPNKFHNASAQTHARDKSDKDTAVKIVEGVRACAVFSFLCACAALSLFVWRKKNNYHVG